MSTKSKNIKSDLKKVDVHSVKKTEYDELPELTDEMFGRAVYKINGVKKSAKFLFEKLDKKFTKAGALLKGLRIREDLSQLEFAKKINVSQANLSKMENGKRPIGKIIAKRIEKAFGTNYRYFLE